MKTKLMLTIVVAMATFAGRVSLADNLGSEFTFQGQLKQAGVPFNGTADFDFSLWDADAAGNQIGSTVSLLGVTVTEGLFTVELDFGVAAFNGEERWLDVTVNGTPLSPRQKLTAAPYAQALPALRTSPSTDPMTGDAPNVIGGHNNTIGPVVGGATISGGGGDEGANTVTGNWGTVSGGDGNTAGPAWAATVGGGSGNTASGWSSTVPGGQGNNAGGDYSFAAGQHAKANHDGSFVWGDSSSPEDFASTGNDQFLIRAAGGVGIGTNEPLFALHVRADNAIVQIDSAQADGTPWVYYTQQNTLRAAVGYRDETAALTFFVNGSDHMVIEDSGQVGIGTVTPSAGLEIDMGATNTTALQLTSSGAGWGSGLKFENTSGTRYGIYSGADNNWHFANVDAGPDIMTLSGPGNVAVAGTVTATAFVGDGSGLTNLPVTEGVWTETGSDIFYDGGNVGIGTDTPSAGLEIDMGATNDTALQLTSSGAGWGSGIRFENTSGTKYGIYSGADNNWHFANADAGPDIMTLNSAGNVGIGTGIPQHKLDVAGRTRTHTLEITGGADIAEPFNVAGSSIEPGMVVCIDPDRLGELRISDRPYDSTVAGVISGAGGVNPGLILTQTDSAADGKYPVALTGRVWVFCDAGAKGIRPGDLLTTSATLGHAMKAADRTRSSGAVIGKAMSSLESGRGLVLVLVSLQ